MSTQSLPQRFAASGLLRSLTPWACSFALGIFSGAVALKSPDSRAASLSGRSSSGSATLPAESSLCVACSLLGGADRGSAPAREAEALEVDLGAVLAPFQSPFQVADLTKLPATQLPAGTSFWDPSQPLPGTFDPSTVDPLFRTAYYDPTQGLVDVASAPWNLYAPAGAPPLFGGTPVRLTGFHEYPLTDWLTSVGG